VTARSDLRLGVGDLLQRPGSRREVQRSVLLSEELAVTGSAIPAGSLAELDLVVESTADPGTLTVSGRVRAPWTGECRRCLTSISGELEAEVRELFARQPIDEDIWPLEGEEIDLAALAREALLLALPLAPLCGDDCHGPAPEAFPTGAGEPDLPTDDDPPIDPRWAALAEVRFDDEPPEAADE
jgi:uncharacterized protein